MEARQNLLRQVHVERPQMCCHLTHTTPETHRLIEENLAETPVYGGWVDSTGPRYCPSIEDKIVRFRDKASHQVRLQDINLFTQTALPSCFQHTELAWWCCLSRAV